MYGISLDIPSPKPEYMNLFQV